MRPRNTREAILPYKSKQLVDVDLPVQRLVLLHPATELDAVKTPVLDISDPNAMPRDIVKSDLEFQKKSYIKIQNMFKKIQHKS